MLSNKPSPYLKPRLAIVSSLLSAGSSSPLKLISRGVMKPPPLLPPHISSISRVPTQNPPAMVLQKASVFLRKDGQSQAFVHAKPGGASFQNNSQQIAGIY